MKTRSVALPITQASGTQLIAAPTKDAGGNPIGGITEVVGFILENKSVANPVTVILHNGTSAAGPIVSGITLAAGTATSPTVADQDYADPRWVDQGLFMEVVGTTPTFAGTVWVQ